MTEQQHTLQQTEQSHEQFQQEIPLVNSQTTQPQQKIQSPQILQSQPQQIHSQQKENQQLTFQQEAQQIISEKQQKQTQQLQKQQDGNQNTLQYNQENKSQPIHHQDQEKLLNQANHPNIQLQKPQSQPNEQCQMKQQTPSKLEHGHQEILSNDQQDLNKEPQSTQETNEPQIPQKQSFFQSILSYFFKPKEVATYPPKFPPPPKENKKTLIFDLDETLIHSSDFPPHPKVESFKMGEPPYYVFKRPGLDDFLRKYSKIFDIFIFTSGYKDYADPIINAICPYLDEQHRLFRNSCTIDNNEIHKDLDAFKRPPTDIILVEDNFNLKKVRPNNTIIVQRWEGVPFDTTLIRWLPQILDDCAKAKDVRDVISKVSDNWHPNNNI